MPLRRYSPDDLCRAASLWDAEQVELYGPHDTPFSDEDILAYFRALVVGTAESLWIVADGAIPQGLMALAVGHIAHLYIEPSSRGRGYGRLLLEHAKAQFPQGLSVHTILRVAPFYVRQGFVQVAQTECGSEVDLEWKS